MAHLAANRIGWNFDRIVPVEEVSTFKPPPFTERTEALRRRDKPSQIASS